MSTQPKLKSVRTIARETAKWIRKNGHYQSGPRMYGPKFAPDGPCCLVQNPAFDRADSVAWGKFEDLIVNQISLGVTIIEWNDQTPTKDVLDTLDKIAAGELK